MNSISKKNKHHKAIVAMVEKILQLQEQQKLSNYYYDNEIVKYQKYIEQLDPDYFKEIKYDD